MLSQLDHGAGRRVKAEYWAEQRGDWYEQLKGTLTGRKLGYEQLSRQLGGQVIVFFAADPSATGRLALDEECAAVERELCMTAHRDAFEFHARWAVGVDDIQRSLNELQPTIIHFSGRGAPEASVVVRGVDGKPHHLTGSGLAGLIRTAASGARLVVLNACHTDAMAGQLCGAVDGVVAMAGAIGDLAARAFAVSLYRALGYMRSVGNAVAQGVAALAAFGLADARLPTCVMRPGLAPGDLVLLQADAEHEPVE